jgi:hypothetical protein
LIPLIEKQAEVLRVNGAPLSCEVSAGATITPVGKPILHRGVCRYRPPLIVADYLVT